MKRDSPPGPRAAKEALRREMRARLRALDPDLRAAASLAICRTAAGLSAFAVARCVALFAPLPSEPDLRPLFEEAWARGKRIVLPVISGHVPAPQLDWRAVAGWDDLAASGPRGLREPDPARCPRIASGEIDCVFVPGLAFDAAGFRLGRGGGFYDAFLASAPAGLARIGLMFSCQSVRAVPREAHDQELSGVVTEEGFARTAAGKKRK